jgi:alpha-1,6-mannosyltransferase
VIAGVHVVQVANYVTPTSGGQRRTLEELGRRYVAAGHRCTLVVPGPDRTSSFERGVRIERLRSTVLPSSGGYRVLARRGPVRALLDDLAPDVVELSDKTTLAWLPAWLDRRDVPTVLVSHERLDRSLVGTVPGLLPWRPILRRWSARAARGAAAIVCASGYAAEEFAHEPTRRVHRIALGVDLDLFRPETPPVAPRTTGRLVAVTRLSPEKRPDVLVDVMRVLHERGVAASLQVAGDGPLRARLERRAQGLPVRFLGHVADRDALARLLRRADVLLAPCPVESFGLAVLEAKASGTPAIVPDGGGAPELVGPGTGVVAPLEPSRWADAVVRLLTGDRAAQARSCRTEAVAASWDDVARSMIELFDRVRVPAGTTRRRA